MTDDELQYNVDHYQPSNEVLEGVAGVKLIAMVGPSGVGKTTIMDLAVWKTPLLQRVKDVTTRAPRGENSDSEFNFMTKDQVIEGMKNKEFVQVALMQTGHLYATRPQDYPRGRISVMAVLSSAVPNFRRIFPDLVTTFIVPKSYEMWMDWFDQRKDDEADVQKRLEEAKTSLTFAANDKQTKYILNDELDKAVDRLVQVADGFPPDDEDEARQLVNEHLEKLQHRN